MTVIGPKARMKKRFIGYLLVAKPELRKNAGAVPDKPLAAIRDECRITGTMIGNSHTKVVDI